MYGERFWIRGFVAIVICNFDGDREGRIIFVSRYGIAGWCIATIRWSDFTPIDWKNDLVDA